MDPLEEELEDIRRIQEERGRTLFDGGTSGVNPYNFGYLEIIKRNHVFQFKLVKYETMIDRHYSLYSILFSSRFAFVYNIDITRVSVIDMYQGREMKLVFENRTPNRIYHMKIWDRYGFKFLNEKEPRFAICILNANLQLFLSVLELDIRNGKLILHQLCEILSLDRRFRLFDKLAIFIDRQAILSERSSLHIIQCGSPIFYFIQFRLEFRKDGIPSIFSQKIVGGNVGFPMYLYIANQKAYNFVPSTFNWTNKRNWREREIQAGLEYYQVDVMDLKELQRVEISQVQQNRVEIADFPEEYKIKQPKATLFYDTNVYYYYRSHSCLEIAIIDLKQLSWTHVYQLNNQIRSSHIITDVFVDNNELMLLFTRKGLEKISTTTNTNESPTKLKCALFPMGRPLSLLKLTFFAARRSGFDCRDILENINASDYPSWHRSFKKRGVMNNSKLYKERSTWSFCSIL